MSPRRSVRGTTPRRRGARPTVVNRAKTDFLSAMSHELRTALNVILAYADLLDQEVRGPMSKPQHDDVVRIRRAGQHLLSLTTQILNYARTEGGRVQYEIRDVLLDDIVADVEGMITPQLHARGLTFAHDACEPDTKSAEPSPR